MTKYYSDIETEQRLIDLEKTIHEEYSKAWQDIHAQAEEYFSQLDERLQAEAKRADVGTPQSIYTAEQWEEYKRVQLERGEGLRKLEADMAQRIVDSDMIASKHINDKTAGIYALNHNYEAYRINQCTGISFNLVDENTVKNLMTGDSNVIEFRTTKINPIRDYEWNTKLIRSALTQGILTGDSIDKIADRFLVVMKRNKASAIRNARTSFTSAQNAGRYDGMLKSHNKAMELGIDLDEQKEWMATKDGRTRDSHAHLDGEKVDIDKPFSNGLMYPADSHGAPAEVYNCRCTMRTVIKGINDEPRETYTDWIERMIDEGYAPQTKAQIERYGDYDKAVERWQKRKEIAINALTGKVVYNIENHYNVINDKGRIIFEDNEPVALKSHSFFNRMNPDRMSEYAQKVEPEEGYDDVFIHGSPTGFSIKDADGKETSYSVREIATYLNEYASFENNKIRLCSCGTGSPDGFVAQALSNLTGKEVLAPDKTLWLLPPDANGISEMVIADSSGMKPNMSRTGKWIRFNPDSK